MWSTGVWTALKAPDPDMTEFATLPCCKRYRKDAFRIAFGCWLLASPAPAWSDDDRLALAVKATYLCKLPAFMTWPAGGQPANTFVMCVVGRRLPDDLLDRSAEGLTVQQRPIELRRYSAIGSNPGCQLMFVTGSNEQPVAEVLAIVRGAPVLTVTDGQTAANSTGIINFVLMDGHVRFEVDQHAAVESGLMISSKLLSLAVQVRNRPGP